MTETDRFKDAGLEDGERAHEPTTTKVELQKLEKDMDPCQSNDQRECGTAGTQFQFSETIQDFLPPELTENNVLF